MNPLTFDNDILTQTRTELMNALNLIFIKWWQVGTGLMASWVTALFGETILLNLTPEFAKAWIPVTGSALILLVTLLFLFRKKNKELRHTEEKHRQELAQDMIDHYFALYERAREHRTISQETTIAEFIATIENINQSKKGLK